LHSLYDCNTIAAQLCSVTVHSALCECNEAQETLERNEVYFFYDWVDGVFYLGHEYYKYVRCISTVVLFGV